VRAVVQLKDSPHYRKDAFTEGVKALGYTLVNRIEPHDIKPDDLLVIWNRYGLARTYGEQFDRAGGQVIVAENCYLGNDFNGGRYYAVSKTHHNGGGSIPFYGPSRWESFHTDIAEYKPGKEIILLPQRGIGHPNTAMPRDWLNRIRQGLPKHRIRKHPGKNECIPLQKDLANAKCVITWGSGAAIKALLMGIPVVSTWDKWIGAEAATPLDKITDWDNIPAPDRLPMFEKLAWGIWEVNEIKSGHALELVLNS